MRAADIFCSASRPGCATPRSRARQWTPLRPRMAATRQSSAAARVSCDAASSLQHAMRRAVLASSAARSGASSKEHRATIPPSRTTTVGASKTRAALSASVWSISSARSDGREKAEPVAEHSAPVQAPLDRRGAPASPVIKDGNALATPTERSPRTLPGGLHHNGFETELCPMNWDCGPRSLPPARAPGVASPA